MTEASGEKEAASYSMIESPSMTLNLNENNITNTNPIMETVSSWSVANICLSIFLFLVAGLFEIGGGYLVWIGIRNKNRPYLFIPLGSLILGKLYQLNQIAFALDIKLIVAYGVIPTFQPVDSFGRVYAVYGGFFIVLSYVWAYLFDNFKPDTGDYIGTSVALSNY